MVYCENQSNTNNVGTITDIKQSLLERIIMTTTFETGHLNIICVSKWAKGDEVGLMGV